MKKSYRVAQEATYGDALRAVKVRVEKVTVHLDGSATIPTTEKATAAVKRIEGVEIISEGKTELTFTIPEAMKYHAEHAPRFTEAEKAKLAEEREARKSARRNKEVAVEVEEETDAE